MTQAAEGQLVLQAVKGSSRDHCLCLNEKSRYRPVQMHTPLGSCTLLLV